MKSNGANPCKNSTESRLRLSKILDRENASALKANPSFSRRYLDPKHSRWMSADPAVAEYMDGKDAKSTSGGIYSLANFNLYHYSNNNPVKYVDPNGKDAVFFVNKKVEDGKTTVYVNIIVPVKYAEGTTQEQKDFFESSAEAMWNFSVDDVESGIRYDITLDVQNDNTQSYANTVTFDGREENDTNISNVKGNKEMTLFTHKNDANKDKAAWTIGHETLHLLKGKDHYIEGKNPDGSRKTTPEGGYEHSISGAFWGQVDAQTIKEVLKENGQKTE